MNKLKPKELKHGEVNTLAMASYIWGFAIHKAPGRKILATCILLGFLIRHHFCLTCIKNATSFQLFSYAFCIFPAHQQQFWTCRIQCLRKNGWKSAWIARRLRIAPGCEKKDTFKAFHLRMGTLQGALCDAKSIGRRKESKGRKTALQSSVHSITLLLLRTI